VDDAVRAQHVAYRRSNRGQVFLGYAGDSDRLRDGCGLGRGFGGIPSACRDSTK